MKLTPAQLAEFRGVDPRTVSNWLQEKPPVPSTMKKGRRSFESTAVATWWEERAARRAVSAEAPDFEKARARKALADAEIQELTLAKLKGELVPIALHEDQVATLADRVAAVATGGLSRYVGEVQLATTPIAAIALLERIGDDVMRACQGLSEELDAEAEAAEALFAASAEG
jgi:hypothetical protein